MKINERTLVHIAQCSENPVDHCGWLLKLNDDKNYQKCWCVLKENLFFYFENKNDKEPLGAIILEGYRVEIVENSEHFAFKIDFGVSHLGTQLKSYTFAAEDHASMERWVKSLSCASYDYLKMVVCELQHRLDELNLVTKTSNLPRIENKGEFKRFNPFDQEEQTLPQRNTFLELHMQYGLIIRPLFRSSNQAMCATETESESGQNQLEIQS